MNVLDVVQRVTGKLPGRVFQGQRHLLLFVILGKSTCFLADLPHSYCALRVYSGQ